MQYSPLTGLFSLAALAALCAILSFLHLMSFARRLRYWNRTSRDHRVGLQTSPPSRKHLSRLRVLTEQLHALDHDDFLHLVLRFVADFPLVQQ